MPLAPQLTNISKVRISALDANNVATGCLAFVNHGHKRGGRGADTQPTSQLQRAAEIEEEGTTDDESIDIAYSDAGRVFVDFK